jgi:RNA polymerase sigma-70 factor (ECF subfamily)
MTTMTEPDRAATRVRALYDAAAAAWPEVAVALDAFAARLEAAGGPEAVTYPGDLYLACGCGAGDAAALRAFDERHLSDARAAIARIDGSPDFVAEVQQLLRERLFVGERPRIAEYRGRGPLGGWVRTAAVRTALNLRRSGKRPPPAGDAPLAELVDPETALLRERHRDEIDRALQNALGRLEPEARLLLRWAYLDRLTLAKIGVLHGVSVPTVHRRLAAATAALQAGVRQDLAERLQLSTASLDSLIRGVDAEMDLSLSRLFRSQ